MSTDRESEDGSSSMNANQIVAYNMRRARKRRGWNQEDLAEALYPYSGQLLKKAAISNRERSAFSASRRVVFDAEEITALAMAFSLPVSWFFIPPPEACETGAAPGDADLWVEQLLALLFGADDQQALIAERIAEIAEGSPARAGAAAELVSAGVAEHGWQNWSTIRSGWIEACLMAERSNLDELFDKIASMVDAYQRLSIRDLDASLP